MKHRATKSISELCEVTSSRRIYKSDYQPEGIPFYRAKEISEKHNGKPLSDRIFISRETFDNFKNKFGAPEDGDLLLTSIGALLGEPYVLKNEGEFYFKDGNLTWFRNFNGLHSEYLYYWLLSPAGKAQLKTATIGSAQPAFTIAALKTMQIETPGDLEQRKIASVLSAYDDLIENNTRRIAILEAMAQAIYREWFVNFRFPGHEKVKLVDSPLGRIPEGWKKPLSDYVDFLEGPGLRRWQYREEGIRFLNIRTIGGNDIDLSKCQFVDPVEVEQKYSHFLLRPLDHIVSSSGTIGRIATVQQHHLPLMLNTSIIRMAPKTKAVGRWHLKHFLQSAYFQDQIVAHASGVAQMNYGPSHLKLMWIIAPDEATGIAYEQHVEPMESLLCSLVKKNTNLRKTRDLLLPKLISGQLDVEEFDIDVGEPLVEATP